MARPCALGRYNFLRLLSASRLGGLLGGLFVVCPSLALLGPRRRMFVRVWYKVTVPVVAAMRARAAAEVVVAHLLLSLAAVVPTPGSVAFPARHISR